MAPTKPLNFHFFKNFVFVWLPLPKLRPCMIDSLGEPGDDGLRSWIHSANDPPNLMRFVP